MGIVPDAFPGWQTDGADETGADMLPGKTVRSHVRFMNCPQIVLFEGLPFIHPDVNYVYKAVQRPAAYAIQQGGFK